MARVELPEKLVAQNRRARFDYFIEETMEAGIVLFGSEVKSLRQGKASINESYATEEEGAIWLINSSIAPYPNANPRFNHEDRRRRKLLLSKKQIGKLIGAIQREGATLVPVKLYFNGRGMAKLELGLAKGKKQHDKRQAIKERDWNRQKSRVMRKDE